MAIFQIFQIFQSALFNLQPAAAGEVPWLMWSLYLCLFVFIYWETIMFGASERHFSYIVSCNHCNNYGIPILQMRPWSLEISNFPQNLKHKIALGKKGLKSFSLSSKSASISMKTPVTTWQMELSRPQDLHSWLILLCIIFMCAIKNFEWWLAGRRCRLVNSEQKFFAGSKSAHAVGENSSGHDTSQLLTVC